ncbi:membrane protein [Cellvibrio zantedeschiae]|uniref:Membrane protein n=1 Tax=Cellvibrio zantedeschiae TaxID=1237077 RepID=A0ABQ3ANJ5_9GAMM|nr:EamA family transporter [Cellvibrio zantedeschiae]GGY61638.1 membrane protein [Cellvibrio zantedeschiae]
MAVLLAYISVVLIWATTPLTIQWSSHSLSFIAAVLLRMAIALAIGLVINAVLRRKLFAQARAWQVYAAGAIGIFPNMPVVYWSAQFIPSGLVAVVFAMSPFVTGLMTLVLLKHNPFSARRVFALCLALTGLVVIFYHQLQFDLRAAYGVAGILLSCFLFSFSSVLVKKLDVKVDAFSQALGTLSFALPCLLVTWWFMDGHIPTSVSMKSLAAVGYLAIFGSLVGAALFFYVLANMSPTAVSLITFMTPVLALILGAWVGHETLGLQLWTGAGLVVIALLLYMDLSSGGWFFSALRRNIFRTEPLNLVKAHVDKYK